MKYNLKGVFSNNDWIIPLGIQGGKRKTQRKRRNQRGYIPDGIRLNTSYKNNLGFTMDEL